MIDRYRHVEGLIRERRDLAFATDECIWLWQHMLEEDPSMYGVRQSFFVAELAELVQAHAPARERFRALRDQLNQRVHDANLDPHVLGDWLSLNKVLDDEDATLAWFDKAIAQPERLPALQRNQAELFPLLLSRGRWEEAGRMLTSPIERLGELWDALENAPSAARRAREVAAGQRELIQTIAAANCAALEAAGRLDEAAGVEREATSRDPSLEMKDAIADARQMARERRPVERLF